MSIYLGKIARVQCDEPNCSEHQFVGVWLDPADQGAVRLGLWLPSGWLDVRPAPGVFKHYCPTHGPRRS